MEPVKIYQTAWRGLNYHLTNLRMGWHDYERCMESSCPGTDLWQYFRGARDAYKKAYLFVNNQVMPLPYEQQIQPLEDYCQQLCIDPHASQDAYAKKQAQENKSIIYYLTQEIVALYERFGTE